MPKEKGYIYILTNPSFPDYVKIGYATDIEKRLTQLNRSETIPYAFRVYAVYETPQSLTDKKVHEIIDGLNPDLRTIENFDGKKRVKEFYAMKPEEAYNLLDCIATISGTRECLKRMKPEGHEILDEEMAEEVREEGRKPSFKFSMIGMEPGTVITYQDGKTNATVVDDSKIELNGETMSLSKAVSVLNNDNKAYQGPKYWFYDGKSLSELRHDVEDKGIKIQPNTNIKKKTQEQREKEFKKCEREIMKIFEDNVGVPITEVELEADLNFKYSKRYIEARLINLSLKEKVVKTDYKGRRVFVLYK